MAQLVIFIEETVNQLKCKHGTAISMDYTRTWKYQYDRPISMDDAVIQ